MTCMVNSPDGVLSLSAVNVLGPASLNVVHGLGGKDDRLSVGIVLAHLRDTPRMKEGWVALTVAAHGETCAG